MFENSKFASIAVNNTCESPLEFAIVTTENRQVLAASYFGRSAQPLSKMMVYIGSESRFIQLHYANSAYNRSFIITKDDAYISRAIKRVINAESIWKVLTVKNTIGNDVVITDRAHRDEDLYSAIMRKFATPIMIEWVPYVMAQNKDCIIEKKASVVTFDGEKPSVLEFFDADNKQRALNLAEIQVYDISGLTEDRLVETIERGLNDRQRPIMIAKTPQQPIVCDSMDHYMAANADLLKDAVKEATIPLAPINGTCDEVRLKHKRLLSQQGAMVNAINTLLRVRKNAFLMEGMGCGKTVQALGSILKYAVDDAKRKYTKKTLKEIYEEGLYSSFVWVMSPGQLCEKWKREAEEEIPNCTATILYNLKDTIRAVEKENKNHGRDLKGIRLYIISKDTAKLGYTVEPSPVRIKHAYARRWVCGDCLNAEGHSVVPRKMENGHLETKCPVCESTNWVKQVIGKKTDGFACPHCGELLLNNKPTAADQEAEQYQLGPYSFQRRNSSNQYCTCCAEPLWGPDVQNLSIPAMGMEGLVTKNQLAAKRWVRVTYFTTFQRASRSTVFSIRGKEQQALAYRASTGGTNFPTDDYNVNNKPGPRKFAIVEYIKKHSRLADFVILDEVHKYSAESGQGHAAHCLIKKSKHSLCLTGTISNGMASSLFHLLWYTEPEFMRSEGYTYDSESRFIKDYGTMEQTFRGTYSEDMDSEYGTVVRSRSCNSPQEKAGLSPILHLKLLGKGIFLDLNDFSSGVGGQMPPLREITRFAKLDQSIEEEYFRKLRRLRDCVKEPTLGGRRLLSKMFRFSLFFPDMPYAQEPVIDPISGEGHVIEGSNMTEEELDFETGGLLNKEALIIEDLKEILNKGERAFVFCECTGKTGNILARYKRLIVQYCGLKPDQVQTISASVQVAKREEWMRVTAEKYDTKVFLCNPALTDTGIDFIFRGDNGRIYNYNNILFAQLGTSLSVQWQASRRVYRLNQTLPCNVFYYAYEATAQATALELMGLKIASVSAAQGRFSSSALAAMSAEVDPRVKLAEALMKGTVASKDEINKIFDDAKQVASEIRCIYDGFTPAGSFYELLDTTEEEYNARIEKELPDQYPQSCETIEQMTFMDLIAGISKEPDKDNQEEPVIQSEIESPTKTSAGDLTESDTLTSVKVLAKETVSGDMITGMMFTGFFEKTKKRKKKKTLVSNADIETAFCTHVVTTTDAEQVSIALGF
jgi:predicted RNA-binding Zn-ribbon protein involved in translation (DUF1610 family)